MRELITTPSVPSDGPPDGDLAAEVLEHGDAMFVLDRELRFVLVNRAFERDSGTARRAVIGRALLEVFPLAADAESPFARHCQRAMTERVALRFESTFPGPGTWNDIALQPLRGGGIAVFLRDVTERHEAEEALAREKDRYGTERRRAEEELRVVAAASQVAGDEARSAVERYERQVRLFDGVTSTTPDFVYVFDREGRFLYANRRLLEVWGVRLADAIGKTCRQLGYEQWHHDMHMREIAQVIATRKPIKGEVPFKAPLTGIFGVYEYIFTPVLGPDGEVEIIAGTTRDVTERKNVENALRESEQRLREAARRKDDFLGMLSHELRNPLAPIRSAAYILRHAPPESGRARRAGEVIERQAEHLTRLVDDLLDVTRIARGKIELRRSPIDVRELVLRAAEDLRLSLEDRGVAFRTALPERKVWADVDATRITQVIGNLLQNAAKFTRRGDEVELTLVAGRGAAELRIRDTGAGIEAALVPHLFEPFVQGPRTLARSEGGLGLGLALVKGIVELHGGTVEARSEGIGRGAEFVVRLPTTDARDAPGAGADDGESTCAGRRVLVVDDNCDAADTLAELLRMLGHRVEVAYDGTAALSKVHAEEPDAVFCDIGLPGMDGYQVAKAVRASGNGRVRLVALSGYAQADDVERSMAAGFDAHVAKPPDPDELARLLT